MYITGMTSIMIRIATHLKVTRWHRYHLHPIHIINARVPNAQG
jgi:hypothetical protein